MDIEHLQDEGGTLRYAEANHCDWIAVAGGDGTSVASDLVDTTLPLGIIPAGTFNNFARSLDLPLDPLDACRVILAGNALSIDVGLANPQTVLRVRWLWLGRRTLSSRGGDQVGSIPEIDRVRATRLPLSASTIRAGA